ncbi:hypothetical protein [Peribacillus sp. CSMR9]|uniref:hypothetical protein n=1 Tax=Peribacillus sp. CSMR9 TaxID=2981350 RepID=UPI0029559A6A|nr:hypothetical protein [Peribacillus sp. CSMR9]
MAAFVAFAALAAFAVFAVLAALHCCSDKLQQASPAAEFVGMDERPPADKDHDMASYSPLYPGYDMDTLMAVQDYDYFAEDTVLAAGTLPNIPALIEDTVLDLGRLG